MKVTELKFSAPHLAAPAEPPPLNGWCLPVLPGRAWGLDLAGAHSGGGPAAGEMGQGVGGQEEEDGTSHLMLQFPPLGLKYVWPTGNGRASLDWSL